MGKILLFIAYLQSGCKLKITRLHPDRKKYIQDRNICEYIRDYAILSRGDEICIEGYKDKIQKPAHHGAYTIGKCIFGKAF